MNRLRKYLQRPGGPLLNQFGHVANPDPNGPNRHTLQSLIGALPGMMQASENRAGSVTAAPLVPRNVCNICGKTFNLAKGSIDLPDQAKSCADCSAALQDGYIVLKAGKHFAFVKSASMADLAGQIVEISEPVMEKVKTQFNLEWKTIEPPPDDVPPQTEKPA